MPEERSIDTLLASSTIRGASAAMTPTDLVNPPPHLPPEAALQLSQSAPHLLSKSPTSELPWPLSILFSSETPDTWAAHENLLKACLRTGDDKSARQCLDRLSERFGGDNERVLALQGLYAEAIAKNQGELEKILSGYTTKVKEDPTLFVSMPPGDPHPMGRVGGRKLRTKC